jgi:hypothetical protein
MANSGFLTAHATNSFWKEILEVLLRDGMQSGAQNLAASADELRVNAFAERLGHAQPSNVEGVLARLALSRHWNNVDERDSVLTLVRQSRREREVFGDGCGNHRNWQTGERQRPQVFFKIADERFANRLSVSDASGNQCGPHFTKRIDANQNADICDNSLVVYANRHGLNVNDGNLTPDVIKIVVGKPSVIGGTDVAHISIVTNLARSAHSPRASAIAKTPAASLRSGSQAQLLLAAVTLQQVHRVDGNCVAANAVVVEVHGFLLRFKVSAGSP